MNTAETILPLIETLPESHPEEIYRKGRELTAGSITLACSFSIEDIVLVDLLKEHLDDLTVFAIDTGRLNEETYEVAESIVNRYGLKVEWYFPRAEAVERLEREKGLFSFRQNVENRIECCGIRKVEPLKRALNGHGGWITGMRREQSITRSTLQPLETDPVNGGILKMNPLMYWTSEQVKTHAEQHKLPVNRLHQQGYPSIGCAPCTRSIKQGEDIRAGRWWWESEEHRECGLHRR